MRAPFNLRRRNFYPWLFLALVVGANAAVYRVLDGNAAAELYLSATATAAALIHFLYSQQHQNTERFASLFKEFNGRYDKLNGRLNLILERDGSVLLSPEEQQHLYDYFNLCAEEYLYFKSGFIDVEVWRAWASGMKTFAKHQEVRRLWEGELKSNSYYGFTLALVDEAA